MQGKKNQILVCQVLKKFISWLRKSPCCPLGLCHFPWVTQALKALEDWEEQQKQSDFTGPLLPSASHFSDFLNSHFVGFFFPPSNSLLYKAGLPVNAETSGFFFPPMKSKPQFLCQRIPCGFGTAASPGPEHDIYLVFFM